MDVRGALDAYWASESKAQVALTHYAFYAKLFTGSLVFAQQILCVLLGVGTFLALRLLISPSLGLPLEGLFTFGAYALPLAATLIPLVDYTVRRAQASYRLTLACDFADVATPRQFVRLVLTNPTRARTWWLLQRRVAKFRLLQVDDAKPDFLDEVARIRRTFKSTELPKLDALDDALRRSGVIGIETLEDTLLAILPRLSSAERDFDAPFEGAVLVS
jgi:hypothetical protein